MNSLKATLTLFTIGALILSACSKYSEGPAMSFRSKTERVSNTWEIYKAMHDGKNVSDQYDQYELELQKDGRARLTADYQINDFKFSYETEGSWEFQNDKAYLELDFEDNSADNTYIILKLEEDEMWLRVKGDDLEFYFVSKF